MTTEQIEADKAMYDAMFTAADTSQASVQEHKHKMFVYGTLKKGKGNHRYFLRGQSTLIEPVRVLEGYRMYTWGYMHTYVPFIQREEGYSVTGEVYLVTDDALRAIRGLEAGYDEEVTEDGAYYYSNVVGANDLTLDYINPVDSGVF